MNEAREWGEVADQLSQVLLALEDVDLNALLDDEVRDLLEYKAGIQEITLRTRQDAQAAEKTFEWVEKER